MSLLPCVLAKNLVPKGGTLHSPGGKIIESVFSRAVRPRRCHDGKSLDPRRSTKNVLD